LKVGGNELENDEFLQGLAAAISASTDPLILVHGGGKGIAQLQAQLGLPTVKVDGLRVTDADSLSVAEMVLSGSVNKLLVKALLAVHVPAVGLSGVDGGTLRCQKKVHAAVDLGFVGEIVKVNTRLLQLILEHGWTPVISPISLGLDGQTYNVNADEAATAIASAMRADILEFVSNVPGVMENNEVIPQLTTTETLSLISAGIIHGGMVPKVNAAIAAVDSGVPKARIVNLAGLNAASGTVFLGQ